MKIITDYILLFADSNAMLTMMIKNYLIDGWQPYGYPLLNPRKGIYQAIVKYEEE